MERIPVIFRKEQGDSIVAFFPTLPENNGTITCYAHIGQHSGATLAYYRDTKPADPSEYADLLRELQGIYNDCQLVVYERMQRHYATKPSNPTPRVGDKYGAPMGRKGAHPGDDPHCIMRVKRIRLDSGGYDNGGAYWGIGQPLWYISGMDKFDGAESFIEDFARAPTKQAAIKQWQEQFPNARVY